MPRGSPFTELCRQTAALAAPIVADLHLHTTASDGDATPEQLVSYAVLAKIPSIAITDHDTTAGVARAQEAARTYPHGRISIVPGVEISAEFDGREIHILGLFLDPDDSVLRKLLEPVQTSRRDRFRGYILAIPELAPAAETGLAKAVESGTSSPGRRHVAGLLVRTGIATSISEAFRKFLIPRESAVPGKRLVPVADAIAAIHTAGGIASFAHPGPDVDEPALYRLREVGLDAVEANFPAASASHSRFLHGTARRLGLRITGGSDFHGRTAVGREIGCRGVSAAEWAELREITARTG